MALSVCNPIATDAKGSGPAVPAHPAPVSKSPCCSKEALRKGSAGRGADQSHAPIHPGTLQRGNHPGANRRERQYQRERMPAVFPKRHCQLPNAICKTASYSTCRRTAAEYGLEDIRYRDAMRISGDELLRQNLPGDEGMYAEGVSGAEIGNRPVLF